MGLSKNFAYRLRTLRESVSLSQEQVAERAALSLSLIAKMEQGRKADPRASTLLALAGALGVRPGQLIENLTPPPDGFFPAKQKKEKKGKKGKKKKKKRLAALLSATANADGATAPASGGDTFAVAPDAPAPATNGRAAAPAPKKGRKRGK